MAMSTCRGCGGMLMEAWDTHADEQARSREQPAVFDRVVTTARAVAERTILRKAG